MLYNKIREELDNIQQQIFKLNQEEKDELKNQEIKNQLIKEQKIYREFESILFYLYNRLKEKKQIYFPEYLPSSYKVNPKFKTIYLLCNDGSTGIALEKSSLEDSSPTKSLCLYKELINIDNIKELSYYSYDLNEINQNTNLKLSNNKLIFDYAFDIPTISFKRQVFFYENYNNKEFMHLIIIDFLTKNEFVKLIKIDKFIKENIHLLNNQLYNLSINLFDLINN